MIIILAALAGAAVGLVIGYVVGLCSALAYAKNASQEARAMWRQIGEQSK